MAALSSLFRTKSPIPFISVATPRWFSTQLIVLSPSFSQESEIYPRWKVQNALCWPDEGYKGFFRTTPQSSQICVPQPSCLFMTVPCLINRVGALQYLALTRLDISFAVNKLSISKIQLKFKSTQFLHLKGYSDADWASNLDDRKSVSGICIFLGGNLIAWSSKKQKVVAQSSKEDEYRALASAATDLVWIQQLLTEIGVKIQLSPPVLWTDNQSTQALASNPVYHSRTKHIEIDVHFVRDLVTEKKLEIRYVPTELQPADILTKALSEDPFTTLRSKLTIEDSMCSLRGLLKMKHLELTCNRN